MVSPRFLTSPPRRRRRPWIPIAVVLVFATFGSAALASPTWRPAQAISVPGKDAAAPQVAVGPTGNATIVWVGRGGPFSIKSVTKPGDALSWSAPQDVSVVDQDAAEPRLGLDSFGNALVVFRRSNGSNTVIQSALRPAGVDAWSAPQTVSAPLQDANSPDVAFDGLGNATAVWRRLDGAHFVVQTAVRTSAGAWTPAQDLSAPGRDATHPQVAVDAAGNAIALWERPDDANFVGIQAAERSAASGSWSAPRDLSVPGSNALDPRVVLDTSGNVTAVWRAVGPTESVVQAAVRSAAFGAWSAPQNVSPLGGNADQVRIAVDPAGRVTAVWRNSNVTGSVVQSATMSATGVWDAPQDLSSSAAQGSQPDLAIDSVGGVTSVWRAAGASSTTIQAANRPPGGTWTAPRDVSGGLRSPDEPHIGLDTAGNGVAVWLESDGANPLVNVAGLDAAGPVLLGVVVPPTGKAGEPIEMLAAAFDVWSGPATAPAWVFGDGRSGRGDLVSKIYRRPGRYTVTVRSADTIGNTTIVRRRIVIAPLTVKRLKIKCQEPSAPGACRVRITFRLSHDASIRLVVRTAAGHAVGTLTRKVTGGENNFVLPRRLSRKVLTEGRYRISLRARVGGAASLTRTTQVTVR